MFLETATWQIMDVGSIWMREFASAFTHCADAVSWLPEMRRLGAFERWSRQETIVEPPLQVERFPLQRGYARAPISWLAPYQHGLLRRLRFRTNTPGQSPLICTTPYYAPLAEDWDGPVIYYSTDLTCAYDDADPAQVRALDRRLCKRATAVCPNSGRIAEYSVASAECDPKKITIVPNATRERNIPPHPLLEPRVLPPDIAPLRRPIAGVIGNLSSNMNWELLSEVVTGTSWLTWVFVGPTSMPIRDMKQAAAREAVMKIAVFTGEKPYRELQGYARAFDVAVLPYKKKEPTFSGSSTRFYEHLPACHPMVATRGFAELLDKPPLLQLADSADEMINTLVNLRELNFRDGQEESRWEASRQGTWEIRARTVLEAAASRA